MTTTRQWLITLLLFSAGVIAGYWVGKPTRPSDCAAMVTDSAISVQAAEICTGKLVGCSMTYAEVKSVIAENEAAKACK